MGRRWTTNQYMSRYERRLERRAFNRMWDDVHNPPSPDGTRRCVDCARNVGCNLNRRGNHGSCFVAINRKTESTPSEDSKTEVFARIVLAVKIIVPVIGWVLLAIWNWTIALIVLIVFILFLH